MNRMPALLIATLVALPGHAAVAVEYPVKPVRIVIPFAAGAAADVVTRAVAHKVAQYWGKQLILDNRPGVPGTLLAAAAPADGYTLLMGGSGSIVTTPLVMKKPPYDSQKAFVPLSQLVSIPPILTTHPSLRVKTVKELIALAKKRPGELNFTSSGFGAPSHLAMELFMVLTGTDMVHVPYKGGAEYVTQLMAGQVQLGFNAIPSVLQFVKAGKLTALAVSTARRAQVLPDLPTVAATVPGLEYNIWYGLFAPSATPAALVQKISADVQRALKEPEVAQVLAAQGAEPAPSSSGEFARYIREDTQRWAKIVNERNLKID